MAGVLPEPTERALQSLSLSQFVAKQTAISTQYGHYVAERVMYEPRKKKREQMLGTPTVDVDDSTGEVLGSWLIRGPGVDKLFDSMHDFGDHLEAVDKTARNWSPFVANVDVLDADRRKAVATALAWIGSKKRLDPTPFVTNFLHSLTGSVFTAVKAYGWGLGAQDTGRRRDVEPDELRLALTALDAEDLLPDTGYSATSRILFTLLNARMRLTTGELADRAGVSKQTLQNRRKELEALEFIVVDETGSGRAN